MYYFTPERIKTQWFCIEVRDTAVNLKSKTQTTEDEDSEREEAGNVQQ